MAKKSKAKEVDVPPFEEAMAELEARVRRLEDGSTTLDEALEDYGKAINLLKTCHARLETAERKIEILSGIDASGQPIVESLDEQEEVSLDKKRERRSQRRSAKSSSRPARDEDGQQESPGNVLF